MSDDAEKLEALERDTPPVQLAVGDHSLIVARRQLYLWGSNTFGQCGPPPSQISEPRLLDGIKNVTCGALGYEHTCFLLADGSLWVMGRIAGFVYREPKSISYFEQSPGKHVYGGPFARHNFVLLEDPSFACFGENSKGQLGLGHTDGVPPESADAVCSLPSSWGSKALGNVLCGVGLDFSVVVACGEVYVCGDSSKLGRPARRPGSGSGPPQPTDVFTRLEGLPEKAEVIDLSVGRRGAALILRGGAVAVWGVSSFAPGKALLLRNVPAPVRCPSTRSPSRHPLRHRAAVKTQPAEVVMSPAHGKNSARTMRPVLRTAVGPGDRGPSAAFVGAAAQSAALSSPTGSSVASPNSASGLDDVCECAPGEFAHIMSVAVGAEHILFVTAEGDVLAAGCGPSGELGISPLIMATPVAASPHSAATSESTAVVSEVVKLQYRHPDGASPTPITTTAVPVVVPFFHGCDVMAIAAGPSISAALSDGKVYLWGDNFSNRLGVPPATALPKGQSEHHMEPRCLTGDVQAAVSASWQPWR